MFVLLSFCSFPWWLAWLLPFLLGLLLGWALWAKWKSQYDALLSEGDKYSSKISSLEADLTKCKSEKSSFDNKIKKLEKNLRESRNRSGAASGISASTSSFASSLTNQQPEGLEVKTLKADIDVLHEKRKELEARIMGLTEERNDWKNKFDEATLQYQKAKEALETSTLQTTDNIQEDDWEARYNHALSETKRKEETIAAKNEEIRRIRDRFSDVDRKISNAEREATEWKIKYNALRHQGVQPSDTSGLSAIAATAPVAAAITSDAREDVTPDEPQDTGSENITDANISSDNDTTNKGEAAIATMYSKIKADELQIIEGIGPKMDSVLKENGIENFEVLASKETADIQAILDKYGDTYRIIDPSSWVEQARLANTKQWKELIDFQKEMNATAVEGEQATSDSKLEKYLIRTGAMKKWTQDDLKAIEGIGPAIEKILQSAGINTWRELSQTPVQKIEQLLNAAGPNFKLAAPQTWPRQAELAADGLFEELQVYQDELIGGRE